MRILIPIFLLDKDFPDPSMAILLNGIKF